MYKIAADWNVFVLGIACDCDGGYAGHGRFDKIGLPTVEWASQV
jgi:hypothetical protein